MSEFFAAIFGAVVGGAISFFIQRHSFAEQAKISAGERKAAKRDLEERKRATEIVLCFSVLLKMSNTHSQISQICDHLHTGVIDGIRKRMQYGAAVMAFSADFPKIEFTLEELSLIRSLKDVNLLNRCILLSNIHAMYADNMRVYRSIRDEFGQRPSNVELQNDGTFLTQFEDADAAKAKLTISSANQLILTLYRRSFHDYPFVQNIFYDLQEGFIRRFGKDDLGIHWGVTRLKDVPLSDVK